MRTAPYAELIREAQDYYCADGNGECNYLVERLTEALTKLDRDATLLVRELRTMVVAAHEAGEIFVHVELGEGGKLLLRAADRFLEGSPSTCEGCGTAPAVRLYSEDSWVCQRCYEDLCAEVAGPQPRCHYLAEDGSGTQCVLGANHENEHLPEILIA